MNNEAKALLNPSLVIMFIQEMIESRSQKIKKVAALAQSNIRSGRAFDIVAQVAAIAKMLDYATAMDDVIGNESERVFDIVLTVQKSGQEELVNDERIVTALAIQACLSHAHLVSEALIDRCLEYIYKSQINSITDELGGHPACDKCAIACDTMPVETDFISFMQGELKFSGEVSEKIDAFLAKAHTEFESAPKNVQRSVMLARINAGNIAKTLMAGVIKTQDSACEAVKAFDWATVDLSHAADVYAQTLASSAMADALLTWIEEADFACRINQSVDPTQN